MKIKLYDDLLDKVVEVNAVKIAEGVAEILTEDGHCYVNLAMNAASLGVSVAETIRI